MFKIECEPKSLHPSQIENTVLWKQAAPFYRNNRGVLTHRVKSARSHIHKGRLSHETIDYWCGNGCVANNGKFSDLRSQDVSKIVVCSRCKEIAKASGQLSTDEIALQHVHVGRAKAVRICCR